MVSRMERRGRIIIFLLIVLPSQIKCISVPKRSSILFVAVILVPLGVYKMRFNAKYKQDIHLGVQAFAERLMVHVIHTHKIKIDIGVPNK